MIDRSDLRKGGRVTRHCSCRDASSRCAWPADAPAPRRTRRGTSPASACRCWCCSASSGSYRTAPSPGLHRRGARRARTGRRPCARQAPPACCRVRCARARRWPQAAAWRPCAGVRNGRQVRDLGRGRLVLGRHAAHGVGDHAVDQLEAVVGSCLVAAARKAEGEQCLVQQVARVVAGERAAGAIGALQARRQPHDQQPRAVGVLSTERGDGAVEPSGLARLVGGAERDQARAKRTVARGFGRSPA